MNDDDDNQTLSSHSSLSELSHAETIEPTMEGKLIENDYRTAGEDIIRKRRGEGEKNNLKYLRLIKKTPFDRSNRRKVNFKMNEAKEKEDEEKQSNVS